MGTIGVGAAAFSHNRRSRIVNDGIPVTAEIVRITQGFDHDGNRRNTAYINYIVDGVEVTAPLRHFSSNMFVGQPIEIVVSRQNPREFTSNSILNWLVPIIMLPLFLTFGGLGLGFLIAESRRKKMQEWLFEYGTPIWAEVLGTEDNWSIQVNGRPAMVLVAEYNNMRFTSTPLDNNDLSYVEQRVKIFLHPDNFNKYAFDIRGEGYRTPDNQVGF